MGRQQYTFLIPLTLVIFAYQGAVTARELSCNTIKKKHSCPQGKGYPLHLTFDDGPRPKLTETITEILKRDKVPATFFVMGHKIDSTWISADQKKITKLARTRLRQQLESDLIEKYKKQSNIQFQQQIDQFAQDRKSRANFEQQVKQYMQRYDQQIEGHIRSRKRLDGTDPIKDKRVIRKRKEQLYQIKLRKQRRFALRRKIKQELLKRHQTVIDRVIAARLSKYRSKMVSTAHQARRQLAKMKREGFNIASHLYEHWDHTLKSEEDLSKLLNKTKREASLLTPPPMLRLPYGEGWVNRDEYPHVLAEIGKAGYTHVGWDIDSRDWKTELIKQEGKILSETLKQICERKGGITLFHDVKKNTAKNLRYWIRSMRCAGHQLVDKSLILNTPHTTMLSPALLEKCGAQMSSGILPTVNKLKDGVFKAFKKLRE